MSWRPRLDSSDLAFLQMQQEELEVFVFSQDKKKKKKKENYLLILIWHVKSYYFLTLNSENTKMQLKDLIGFSPSSSYYYFLLLRASRLSLPVSLSSRLS